MREVWKVVPGYDGRYKASNLGRLKSIFTYKNGVKIKRDIIFKSGVRLGYWQTIVVTPNGRKRNVKIHRLIATAFLGPCPKGKKTNHKNGKRWDNRPENLEWVTDSENMLHAYQLGLKRPMRGEANGNFGRGLRGKLNGNYGKGLKGELNGRAKLNWPLVRKIREEGKWGSCREVGKKWGICKEAARNILLYKTWREVFRCKSSIAS